MLAQNFMTAKSLKLTQKRYHALVLTLNLMETRNLIHTPLLSEDDDRHGPKSWIFTGHFNMSFWNMKHECGTICCIGGTAEIVGRIPGSFLHTQDEDLEDLFFPAVDTDFDDITVEHGARALRNYLTFGKAKWKEVLNEPS